MLRTILGIAVAGFIVGMVPGHAQAAPATPLPVGVVADLNIMSDVARRCWRDRWGRLHCRRCWRDGWGRVRCW
jgi:hypothetical protein